MITSIECPFCHVSSNPAQTGGYCDDCGRRLPVSSHYSRHQKKPRTHTPSDDEPIKRSRLLTPDALFTASILRLVLGGGFLVVGPVFLPDVPRFFVPAVLLVTTLGTAFFGLMGLMSYRRPFPAAVIALTMLVVAWLALLAAYPLSWPLAFVDMILIVWLIRTVAIARNERI